MTDKSQEQVVNENAEEQVELTNEEQETEATNEETQEEEQEPISEEERLQNELNEMKDKHMRLVAEFDNFRKRTAKERVDLIATAGRSVVEAMLDVLDDCNRAAKQMETEENIDSVKEGSTLVFNKLNNILQQKGVKEMDSMGKEFDPELHEAITEIPAPSEDMQGKVMDVVQPGYYLNDKIIRHAKVVVGK